MNAPKRFVSRFYILFFFVLASMEFDVTYPGTITSAMAFWERDVPYYSLDQCSTTCKAITVGKNGSLTTMAS